MKFSVKSQNWNPSQNKIEEIGQHRESRSFSHRTSLLPSSSFSFSTNSHEPIVLFRNFLNDGNPGAFVANPAIPWPCIPISELLIAGKSNRRTRSAHQDFDRIGSVPFPNRVPCPALDTFFTIVFLFSFRVELIEVIYPIGGWCIPTRSRFGSSVVYSLQLSEAVFGGPSGPRRKTRSELPTQAQIFTGQQSNPILHIKSSISTNSSIFRNPHRPTPRPRRWRWRWRWRWRCSFNLPQLRSTIAINPLHSKVYISFYAFID